VRRVWRALASLALVAAPASATEVIDGGRYGPVHLGVPKTGIRGYVVYYGGADGWEAFDDRAVAELTREGALTVGVDITKYLATVAGSGKPCDQLVGDVEMLSRQLQRAHPGAEYTFPILAGRGEGGALAYAVLAQAPTNTLSGAVSLDPAPDVATGVPLCPGAPTTPTGPGRFRFGPKADLKGYWTVGVTDDRSADSRAFVAGMLEAHVPLTQVRLGKGAEADDLAVLVAPHLPAPKTVGVEALPLIDLPAESPNGMMAVVLAGDGGWRDIDKTISESLQARGVSVVGWDSLRYFWREKTPDQTAADLDAVLETYARKWKADKIALIGYSFGADVLPFVYDRLRPELKRKIVLVSLLGLEDKADWEITVTGWLGEPPTDAAIAIAPAIAQMPDGLIQCFYGAEEHESACPSLDPKAAELIETSGGHHFGHDYRFVTDKIMEGFLKRASG
jgi:type IV secretory pathway VirJ component